MNVSFKKYKNYQRLFVPFHCNVTGDKERIHVGWIS